MIISSNHPSTLPTRRTFVKLGGAAAALGVWGRSLVPAHAADLIPKRVVIFYSHHGMVWSTFKPTGPGGVGNATRDAFEMGSLLSPLAEYKKDLVVMSGLDMRSWTRGRMGNGHEAGQTHSLSNIAQASAGQAGGPSIDQFIAKKLAEQNNGKSPTAIPSFVVTVGGGLANMMTWSAARALVPAEPSPQKVFARAFPGGQAPGNAGVDLGPMFRRRRRSLGLASSEMKAIGAQLDKQGRERLDAHASVISDLQKRLETTASAPRSCTPPANVSGSGWEGSMDGHLRVIQSSFACDITRVATILADPPPGSLWNGGDAHNLAHAIDTGYGKDANGVATLTRYNQAYAKQMAKLIKLLKEVPEADGKTLFDHTMILWCSEIASGGHGCANNKLVLAGSAGGQFKTGRYLGYGDYQRCAYCGDEKVPGTGNVFVSMAQAMGVKGDTFGVSTGGLAGLTEA